MNDYVLYTDSTSDLTVSEIEQSGVKVIPMEFTLCDKAYTHYPDARELNMHEFYESVRAGNGATTTLVNVESYIAFFEPELKNGLDVVYICFSSGLSGSINCAKTAAGILEESYPDRRLYVVDSLSASRGEGLLVWHAALQKKSGLGAAALASWVEENRLNLVHWFTVDDLEHLRRGGRVSAAAAFFGGMLNIKPVLNVDNEGHLIPMLKARGRVASIDAMVDEMAKTVTDAQLQTVFIGHGDSPDDAMLLADKVNEQFHPKEINVDYIGPVIGAHSGPGTLALFFLGTGR